uniref:ATP synthase subunit a n=1 Tax=Brachycybe lecontii TaxID=1176341 RepID=S4T0T2_BRALC|nr:ATP synthase F0 subunit 6 [Brachycybe lecontii]AFR77040.1 ATP synthetase F0 Subunit 6 [Brachycybe lecontii]
MNMMTNLFSIFDPATSLNFNLNWTSTFILLFIIPLQFWFQSSRMKNLMFSVSKNLNQEFSNLLKSKFGMTSLFISIFLFIMINNVLGLFPYIFTSSSHLSFTLSLALPMWMTIILFSWMKNTKNSLAHLVPQGTPIMLMMFMVCIEMISQLIRPLTLAVRLAANMIAGHLLMTLLGNLGTNINTLMFPLFLVIQLLLIILESAVAIIQAYVFSILLTLYVKEV